MMKSCNILAWGCPHLWPSMTPCALLIRYLVLFDWPLVWVLTEWTTSFTRLWTTEPTFQVTPWTSRQSWCSKNTCGNWNWSHRSKTQGDFRRVWVVNVFYQKRLSTGGDIITDSQFNENGAYLKSAKSTRIYKEPERSSDKLKKMFYFTGWLLTFRKQIDKELERSSLTMKLLQVKRQPLQSSGGNTHL